MNRSTNNCLSAAACALALLALPPAARPAYAQDDMDRGTRTVRRVIRDAKFAYLPLAPFTVCGPTVLSITVSPDGESALVVRRVATPIQQLSDVTIDGSWCGTEEPPSLEELKTGQGETQIILIGKASAKGRILWRSARNTTGYADIAAVQWLPTTDTAYVNLRRVTGDLTTQEARSKIGKPGGPAVTLETIRVDAMLGKTQTVLNGAGDIITAKQRPLAACFARAGTSRTIIRLEATGKAGTAIPVSASAVSNHQCKDPFLLRRC